MTVSRKRILRTLVRLDVYIAVVVTLCLIVGVVTR